LKLTTPLFPNSAAVNAKYPISTTPLCPFDVVENFLHCEKGEFYSVGFYLRSRYMYIYIYIYSSNISWNFQTRLRDLLSFLCLSRQNKCHLGFYIVQYKGFVPIFSGRCFSIIRETEFVAFGSQTSALYKIETIFFQQHL